MSIETSKDNLCINQMIGQKMENIVVEGDAIVPDIKPDILNTISTNGNICIYKKEIMDGKVRIDGSVNTCIMYLADDPNCTVRSLNTSLDFTHMIDMDHVKPGMTLESCFCLKSIECKVLNGRKVNLKATVEAKVKVYSNENVEFIKKVNCLEDIQILNKNFKINSLVGNGMTKVYAKDTLMIDSIDNLAEVMKTNVQIVNKDIKISYNKVLVKADVSVKMLYLTEDNRISTTTGLIPIMGFIDMPDVSEDNLCDTNYEMKNIVVKPNSVEEHSIYVEAEFEINCAVYANKEIQMIQDLYSPSTNLEFMQKQIDTMQNKKVLQEVCNIRKQEQILEIRGNKIYDVEVLPVILSQNIANDRINYEGEIQLTYLFASDMGVGIDTKTMVEPFTFNMACAGMNNKCNIDTQIDTILQDFIVMPDESIDIKVDLNFMVSTSETANMNIIDDVKMIENRDTEVYSIVIYYVKPGDTLWSIAKRFGSTVEDIVRVNGIEDENKIKVGEQLFIPRYAVTKITTPA